MTAYRISAAEPGHIPWIVADARQADIDEVAAASGGTIAEALAEGLARSSRCWTGFADDQPICMFGVSSVPDWAGIGVPWMLGTNAVEVHAWGFLKRARGVLDQMRAEFPVLLNYVDARNATAMRWLRWMGFTIHDPEPYGELGLPFHRFTMGTT